MRPRRLEWIYKEHPIYYLTLVAHNRRKLFANPTVHSAFIVFAKRSMARGIAVGRYVVMPDHVHLFAAASLDLSKWVKSVKNSLSKCLRRQGIKSPHWQKDFFDRVLRSEESYCEKWEYVRQNPVRAGLVKNPEEWEFQGEICRLEGPFE